MQKITFEEIEAVESRLVGVRQDIANQEAFIAETKRQISQAISRGLSVMSFVEQEVISTQKIDLLRQTEKILDAELDRLKCEKLAYDAALDAAKDELQALEEAQMQNIIDYFLHLAGTWEAAFTAAGINGEAKRLESQFRNDLLCRYTSYGSDYLNDIEKLLALLEVRQPEAFKRSGVPTYSQRHKRAAEACIHLIA